LELPCDREPIVRDFGGDIESGGLEVRPFFAS
jgi:hypothetical protein